VVGCDLDSNTATINLYVVDESFDKGMTTDDKKIVATSNIFSLIT